MRIDIEDGWVPEKLVRNENGPVGLAMRRLSTRSLVEPFISFDLEKSGATAFMRLEQLLKLGERLPVRIPDGMIFHLSRSGSTLISELFRCLDECVVISEPVCVSNVLQSSIGDERKVLALRGLIRIFSLALCRPEQRLIVKFTSWNGIRADLLRRAFNESPSCFVYRTPEEVIASLIADPPEWRQNSVRRYLASLQEGTAMTDFSEDDVIAHALSKAGADATKNDASIYAAVLGQTCKGLLSAGLTPLPIDYRSLPDSMIERVAPHFGVSIMGSDHPRIRAVSRWNTKSIGRIAPFRSGTEKHSPGKSLVYACEKFVHRPLRALTGGA